MHPEQVLPEPGPFATLPQAQVQPLPISSGAPSCSPGCVDPDDVQVTEVDAFLVQPAVAGTSLGPGRRGQVRLAREMAQTCGSARREP